MIFLRLRSSAEQGSVEVREAVAQILGVMACICNSPNLRMTGSDESRLDPHEYLCPKCDKARASATMTFSSMQETDNREAMKPALLILWRPLLSKLSIEEVSDRVQVFSPTSHSQSYLMEINQMVPRTLNSFCMSYYAI